MPTSYSNLRHALPALFLILMSAGCGNQPKEEEQNIDLQDLQHALADSSTTYELNLEELGCTSYADTVHYNIAPTFQEAQQLLKNELSKIDRQPLDSDAQTYIKSLILADFVYAAFSYQFLGPEAGMEPYEWHNKRWSKLPLTKCFQIGNNNTSALYCKERTSFYIRLADRLLGLQGRSVTVSDVHTFPLMTIGNASYIVDPSDPFVIVDSAKRHIVNYKDLTNTSDHDTYIPIRTRRRFGPTRELVSASFVEMLHKRYHDTTGVCVSIPKYLRDHKSKLLANAAPCTKAILPSHLQLRPVKSDTNLYAIKWNSRADGPLADHQDILNYYTDKGCETKRMSHSE